MGLTRKRTKTEQEREKARLYSAEYHARNRDAVLAKMKERNRRYYEQNKERIKARSLAYQVENAGSRNAYKANWNRTKKMTDPQFAAITMMRKLVGRTCERIKVGRSEIGRTVEALGYTTEEFRLHLEAQFRDGMNWANHGQWHVDHIKPLSSFDLTDPEQRKAANALENLQPLWASENMAKGARLAKVEGDSE